jgi:hypothetical protein
MIIDQPWMLPWRQYNPRTGTRQVLPIGND